MLGVPAVDSRPFDCRWQFAIDVGGTFTDCVACSPEGRPHRQKVLSSSEFLGTVGTNSNAQRIVDLTLADPAGFWTGYKIRLRDADGRLLGSSSIARHADGGQLLLETPLPFVPNVTQTYTLYSGEDSPILAIRRCLGASLGDALPVINLRLGTTLGTNALLTRSGASTTLVVTRGFADILEIGYQDRPQLFELNIRKPRSIYDCVIEIDERVAADGSVLKMGSADAIRQQLARVKQCGVRSLAVCLLHAYLNPVHEQLVEQVARELGFQHVHVSHKVAPLLGAIRRARTTVTDAYLGPVLLAYLDRLSDALHPDSQLRLMTSAGGLIAPEFFSGKDSLLSGPAGGVVGYAQAAEAAGFLRTIGFDMGGTSTDVSRYAGRYETVFEINKNGASVSGPAMDIETVAAGGGSICHFDGVKLVVGPESAAAKPGPACYGRGGPLTVTDMNLALGRLLPSHFPFPLEVHTVQRMLTDLAQQVSAATGQTMSIHQLADGFVRIANTQMAEAMRTISVNQGQDPRKYVLSAFGGAAPQHACALAGQLDIQTILIHPDGGILSAVGIAAADWIRHATAPIYQLLTPDTKQHVLEQASELTVQLSQELAAEHIGCEDITTSAEIELRYQGQESTLRITSDEDDWHSAFEAAHRHLFGYAGRDRSIEIVAIRAEAVGRANEHVTGPKAAPSSPPPSGTAVAMPVERTVAYFEGQRRDTPVFDRQLLRCGSTIDGPAIVIDAYSTIVIEPGWRGLVQPDSQLVLTQAVTTAPPSVNRERATDVDPVSLEVFNCRFAAIAKQMGVTLQKTASSVNVKERLDFSCAIFTPRGELVVNAPHMPVHLGSMSETVRHLIVDHPDLEDGDVLVTNDPYRGGSHLPDVTVVTPVFAETGELLFFTASRAHHAEIGGTRPGSMPPDSKNLAEEGVLIRSMKIVAAGQPRFDALRKILTTGDYPSRAVPDNLDDIRAQIASNQQGVRDLLSMAAQDGVRVVQAYMQHIQNAAATKMRSALLAMLDGTYRFGDEMDDGAPICVTVTVDADRATVDFTGSATTHPGNLNANPAIVRAAVIYCFRCLIDEDIPLNEGVLQPITMVIPPGILDPPATEPAGQRAAVVGGNVETSQRIVDVLLGALGLAAASQGTMNNLLFGDATFGYYETICGGAGATPQAVGADAVHTHMTNTRLTDPEVLEHRFPVRLHQFAVRRGSGGDGVHRGGSGTIREMEFLQPLDVSLLTQRRTRAPFGLDGGSAGSVGENELRRTDGTHAELGGIASFRVAAGDTLVVRTPGGGGWKKGGEAKQAPPPSNEKQS